MLAQSAQPAMPELMFGIQRLYRCYFASSTAFFIGQLCRANVSISDAHALKQGQVATEHWKESAAGPARRVQVNLLEYVLGMAVL